MISPEMSDAINKQIQQEFSSAYVYLGMAAYFETENLAGFAHWCEMQYEEERQHAMRLFRYLLDRGGDIQLADVPAAKVGYSSPLEVFQVAQQQEQDNTKLIDALYQKAWEINDHATISHLQWFVDEQVEEEKSIGEIISLVERASSDVNALLYLNDKLGARTPESAPE